MSVAAHSPGLSKAGMETSLRGYFEACNSGDPPRIAAFFEPEAVHYFPGELYGGPCRGAALIGEKTQMLVEKLGAFWTLDRMVCDPDSASASTEWTLENRRVNVLLRGSEWYLFGASGRLAEVRAYVAVAPDRSRTTFELGGFDYTGHGYARRTNET